MIPITRNGTDNVTIPLSPYVNRSYSGSEFNVRIVETPNHGKVYLSPDKVTLKDLLVRSSPSVSEPFANDSFSPLKLALQALIPLSIWEQCL